MSMSTPPLTEAEKRKFMLSDLFFALRVYYAATTNSWARNGLVLAPFTGMGFGQMQFRPPPLKGRGNTAHVISGLNNIHVGLHAEYGFGRFFHVGAESTMNFQFPTVLFVADLLVFAGVHH